MEKTKERNPDVMLSDLVDTTPFLKWFDKHEFSAATGVSVNSANGRLLGMRKDGYLIQKKGDSVFQVYYMSVEGRELMKARAKENKKKRGLNSGGEKAPRTESEIRIEKKRKVCEEILRKVGIYLALADEKEVSE